jgi:hypothetical protein
MAQLGAVHEEAGEVPRMVQILSTEHWSLLSARSLAYNEAFTRAGMFLAFLSMSLVALALLAQGLSFTRDVLVIAAIVLAVDLLIGLTTVVRLVGAYDDDLRAVHGMSRLRHAYVQLEPGLAAYLTAPFHDDPASVGTAYGVPPRGLAAALYAISSSLGMVVLIESVLAGVTAGVIALAAQVATALAWAIGGAAGFIALALLIWLTARHLQAFAAHLPARFPAP